MFKSIYTTRMSDNGKTLYRRFEKINAKPMKLGKILAVLCSIVLIASFALSTLVMAQIAGGNESYTLEITNNGEIVSLENKPFVKGGEVYVPLRELFTKIGLMKTDAAKMEWDNGVILINLCHENLNEEAAFTYESYMYKIEIGNDEFVINPEELSNMSTNYEFTEKMNGAPILQGNITYVPFSFAQRLVERADNGIQSPSDRYDIDIIYSGEIFSVKYPFESFYNVTEDFGIRVHPITGEEKFNSGVSFKAPEGTTVLSGIDGKFVVGFHTEKGAYMTISSENGVKVTYYHLDSEILGKVWRSNFINKGDVVGYVGNTGMSTGDHLCMEVKINDEFVNPQIYFEKTDDLLLVDVINRNMPRQLIRSNMSEYTYSISDILWNAEKSEAKVTFELTNGETVKTMETIYYKMENTDIWHWREATIN